MKVGKDGSVYLGPRLRNITTVRQGVKRVEEGKLSIRYEEGQEVASHHKAKISFHASGHINTSGSRLLRNSIREIKNQQELCRVLFRHPSHFPPGSNVGKRDILLDYPLPQEDCLLEALIFISPIEKTKLIRVRGALYQTTLMCPFSGLNGVPDLTIQLAFFHGGPTVSPPFTYILFGTLGAPW